MELRRSELAALKPWPSAACRSPRASRRPASDPQTLCHISRSSPWPASRSSACSTSPGEPPFIVFDDADLDEAVAGAIQCKFRNTGQTCISANRILVQDGIHDEFVGRFVATVGDLAVGPGTDPGVVLGPLIDQDALEKVERHIADAVSKGATVVAGGERHALGSRYFEPTVLLDVQADMASSCEETFGRVAGISRF